MTFLMIFVSKHLSACRCDDVKFFKKIFRTESCMHLENVRDSHLVSCQNNKLLVNSIKCYTYDAIQHKKFSHSTDLRNR